MMETIISKDGRKFRMAVIYNKSADQYSLQFASTQDNRGQEVPCTSFADARSRFLNNVRFYHGSIDVVGVPFCEEEFLGITPGLLGPNPSVKEVC